MRSLCIKVHKKGAEAVKKKLIKSGALNNLKWKRDGEYVLIPVRWEIEGYEICEDDFQERKRQEKIGAFDIVGDIAIIKFKNGIDFQKLADKLIQLKNINKVAIDYGVKGTERIRKLSLILGEDLNTLHREFGVVLKVDLSKVYFSPRLAMERWRVVNMVKNGEVIFDMFAGCGPFSIMIAKYRKVKIYATDINSHAIKYLKENIKINKVRGIEPILGDAREIASKIKVDRIIMNLPHSSYNFLSYAFKASKKGTVIHYYEILPRNNNRKKDIISLSKENNIKIKILEMRKVHAYSPSRDMLTFILKVI